ncbi:hypothetical protein BT93_L3079 [Corymbia citriodora subsp. variegata]|uniref:F-box domain-containing protein n=1 Tax=Corymbia citriodora subsp. variegata TaxID=360336 RepID=A0A8T0CKL7_CORYI|nr:hypothetical protein BT93_L3079 [Corymbia citriodora subsp. variegata]
MSSLPNELFAEILHWLPVKLLLRFRCVSKPWRSLIDSPGFIKLHLDRSLELSTNLSLFLRHSSGLYSIDLGSPRLSVVEMNCPLRSYSGQIPEVGSCHGLLCLCNNAGDVVIWNPSTRKHKFLPHSPVEVPQNFFVRVYGFGFDDEHDDYLLLRLVQFAVEPIESEVSIYSLKANTWRRLRGMPCFLVYPRKMGVFACGRLHWIMTRDLVSGSANLLVAFNFHTEDFEVVFLPDVIDNRLDMDVAVLGGCLCLSISNDQMGVDVWIMKEYRLNGTWAKLFSISPSQVRGPLVFVRPLAYSQNGRQVLVQWDSQNLAWYDLETECIEMVDISGMPSLFEAEVCLRTLVSVDDYGCTKRENRNARDELLAEHFNPTL